MIRQAFVLWFKLFQEVTCISRYYQGDVERITVEDCMGYSYLSVAICEANSCKACFPEIAEEISSYQDALKVVMEHVNLEETERNV